jgi:hypothetical protein
MPGRPERSGRARAPLFRLRLFALVSRSDGGVGRKGPSKTRLRNPRGGLSI